ncbi:transposase [Streptomyces sp. NPDC002734]|uniref:transposase n=1 Tax=Streptomyces sp. NPDC002734 TaxID=3154426 RepID=UPI003317BEEC
MVDTLIPDLLDPEETRRSPVAMKDYSRGFKADAVALFESIPGSTCRSIAADLGITRNPLRNWVLRARERRGVGPDAARETSTAVRATWSSCLVLAIWLCIAIVLGTRLYRRRRRE